MVDSAKPAITGAASYASGAPYIAGTWTNQNVIVTFSCSDNPGGSGIASLTPPQTVTTEGGNQSVTGTCTDVAGNVSTATFSGINIDRTPPTITYLSQTPPANVAGWNNTNVTLTWSCSDSGSGPVSLTVTQTITVEGTGLSGRGTCTDLAGNQASNTHGGINIDKTPPTITANISPAPAATGWYNLSTGPPTITFVCADNAGGSGIAAGACPAPLTLGEGASQSVFRNVSDRAGNLSALSGFSGINVDLTPPSPPAIIAPGGSSYLLNAKVAASYSCSDALSGIASCTGTVPNGSNLSTSTLGQNTFAVTVTDKAGNSNSTATTYYVVYNFVLTPVKSPANLGSAVPLVWQLTDSAGKIITDMSSLVTLSSAFTPGVQPVNGVCPITYPGITQVPLYSPATGATGGSNLRQVSNGFQFNWNGSTATSTGPGCYTIVWQLKDDAGPAPGYTILNPNLLHMTAVQLK
jgi:hypothetical protein